MKGIKLLKILKKLGRKMKRLWVALSDDDIPILESLNKNISREKLKRSTRILVIDDDPIDLVKDLQQEGFIIEQDQKGDDISKIERGYFDLVILDFKGVGKKYGNHEGLDLLKTIKRVNPAVYVLTYTTQTLPSTQSSEFYTLSDGNLNKEAGVGESVALIEASLRKSVRIERLWSAILKLLDVSPETPEARDLEKKFLKSVRDNRIEKAKHIFDSEGEGSLKDDLLSMLIEKAFDIAIGKWVG